MSKFAGSVSRVSRVLSSAGAPLFGADIDLARHTASTFGPTPLPQDVAEQLLIACAAFEPGRLLLWLAPTGAGGRKLLYVSALTPGGPAEDDTVTIGGDRYMEAATPEATIGRAQSLARGMEEKAATALPNIREFLRGKKSTFTVLDADGGPTEAPDYEVRSAYTAAVGWAIPAFNKQLGDGSTVPGLAAVSASPDVWTGPRWPSLCDTFRERRVNPRYYTCPPAAQGGFGIPSSLPTAAGVDEALLHYCAVVGLDLVRSRILFDAGGTCTEHGLASLLKRGVAPSQVTVVEPDLSRVDLLRRIAPGARFIQDVTHEAIGSLRDNHEILLANGPGDLITAANVEALCGRGLRVALGCANNLFRIEDDDAIAHLLTHSKVVSVPSPTLNFGGWVMAAVERLARACGIPATSIEGCVEPLVRSIQRRIANAIACIAANDSVAWHLAGRALVARSVEAARRSHVTRTRSPHALLEAILSSGEAARMSRFSIAAYGFDECGFFELDRAEDADELYSARQAS
jgi:hypothetical protein